MSELIKRQDAIDVVGQLYRYESDRMTALQELPTVNLKPVEQYLSHVEKILGSKTKSQSDDFAHGLRLCDLIREELGLND